MGIFTKREYLCDGVCFITKIRLFGVRHGMYRLMVARKDLPEDEINELLSEGVYGSEKARYFDISGYRGFFGNKVSMVDFYTADMRLFATVSNRNGTRVIKYYDQMEDGSICRRAHSITYETEDSKHGYRFINRDVNAFVTDSEPIMVIRNTKTFFVNKNIKDNDIVSIERIMNYDVMEPGMRPKTDLLTITFGNDRKSSIVVNNQNDDILSSDTELPSGRVIYIYKNMHLAYTDHYSDPIDDDQDKIIENVDYVIEVGESTSKMKNIYNGGEYEFDSSLLDLLMHELAEAKYPEEFVTKVITNL